MSIETAAVCWRAVLAAVAIDGRVLEAIHNTHEQAVLRVFRIGTIFTSRPFMLMVRDTLTSLQGQLQLLLANILPVNQQTTIHTCENIQENSAGLELTLPQSVWVRGAGKAS